MHADKIRFSQCLFERHVADPRTFLDQAALVPQIMYFLDGFYERVVLVRGVVAQHVHVESDALFDERQPNAPGANHSHGLPRDLVAEKRQVWIPESPLVVPGQVLRRPHSPCQRPQHEERKLRRRFGENVSRMGKWDLVAVGIRPVDVVKPHRNLGDHL